MSFMPSAVALAVLTLLATHPALAERSAAVFDFELVDTSRGGERHDPRADEQRRLELISRDLRERLAAGGSVGVVDIAPVVARAHDANLQSCGGCDVTLAAELGAALSITGTVHKVSELVLNMRIYVREVASGRLVATANADMRGNTDETWSRTLAWLVKNRLGPALAGAQP